MVTFSPTGISYESPDDVRRLIALMAEHHPDDLADVALGLLAELERERE